MRTQRLCLCLLGFAAIVAATTPAHATPVLDQSCCASETLYAAFSGRTQAQTFTVGITGQLTEIDVPLFLSGSGSVQFDVVSAFAKGATLTDLGDPLATFTVSWSSQSGGNRFVPLDFSGANLFVTTGEKLALVQRPAQNVLGFWVGTIGSLSTTYAGGEALSTTTGLPDTFTNPYDPIRFDLGFRTLVDPVPVPEPSTLLLLASGLAGLGGMAWRRHRRS